MIPRLVDFSYNISSYPYSVNNMLSKAININGYWTFDQKLISIEDAAILSNLQNDVVVSNKLRVVGLFSDIILLGKLMGNFYQLSNREIMLPNFSPEETYWIKLLELSKLSPSLIQEPTEQEVPVQPFWKSNLNTFFKPIEISPIVLPGALSPVSK